MPPSRASAFGPMHASTPPFAQQQGGHPMGAGGGGAGGGGVNVGHSQLLDRERYTQQQQAAYHAQVAQVHQAAAAAAQRNQQQQQHQQQQQQQPNYPPNLLGLLGRGGTVNAPGISGGIPSGRTSAGPQAGGGTDNRALIAPNLETKIRDVWAEDLHREMAVLRKLVDEYQYVAMDTEFPGIVARPIGQFKSKADYHYQTLRCNVDMLKIIQLGITLADENGKLAEYDGHVCTWQFNFKFSLDDDMYAQESIDLLTKSGIDFNKHSNHGIDVYTFGDLLISSGLVMLDDVKWISFHSGYDFGYLVKIMSCTPLPTEETEFRNLLSKYFPALYDIKFLMKSYRSLKGGLQDIAEGMGISRVGPQHQAGSDSLLTGNIFFEMRDKFFDGKIDDSKYLGRVWGLDGTGVSPPYINGIGTVVYNNGIPIPSTPTNTGSQQTNVTTPSQSTTPGPMQNQPLGTPGTPGPFGSGNFGKIGM